VLNFFDREGGLKPVSMAIYVPRTYIAILIVYHTTGMTHIKIKTSHCWSRLNICQLLFSLIVETKCTAYC